MASSCGTSYASSLETTNYLRICRIVVDVLRDILWQVLTNEILPADLPKKVQTDKKKLGNLNLKIKTWLCGISPPSTEIPSAEKFDVSSLYTLIRNLCNQVPTPTNQWGGIPSASEITLGDDIERVREFRNTLYGHATQSKIENADFNKLCKEIKDVAIRFDAYFCSLSKAMKCDFQCGIDTILTCFMDKSLEDDYIEKIKESAIISDGLIAVNQQVGDFTKSVHDAIYDLKKDGKENAEDSRNRLCRIQESLDMLHMKKEKDKVEGTTLVHEEQDSNENAGIELEMPQGMEGRICIIKCYVDLKLELTSDIVKDIAKEFFRKRKHKDVLEDLHQAGTRRLCIDRLLKRVLQLEASGLKIFFDLLKRKCPGIAQKLAEIKVIDKDRESFTQVSESVQKVPHRIQNGLKFEQLDVRFFQCYFQGKPEKVDKRADVLLSQFRISIYDHSQMMHYNDLVKNIHALLKKIQSCHFDSDSEVQSVLGSKLYQKWQCFKVDGSRQDDIGHIKQQVGNVNQKVGHVKDQVHEVKVQDSDFKKNFEVVQNTLHDVQKGSAPTWNFKLENVRKAWRSIEEVLVEELSPRHILDVFTEECLLSPDQCQNLRKKKRREMSKELLQIVKDDLPDAFFVLLKALKEDGEDKLIHLLTNIIDEKKYVEEFTDDIGHIKQQVGNVNQKVGHVKDQVRDVKNQGGDVKDQVHEVKDQVHEVKVQDSDLKKNFEVVQNPVSHVQKGLENQGNWYYLQERIQSSKEYVTIRFRKVRMLLMEASEGSLVLKFVTLGNFDVKLLKPEAVKTKLWDMIKTLCPEYQDIFKEPVHLTIFLKPLSNTDRAEIYFYLETSTEREVKEEDMAHSVEEEFSRMKLRSHNKHYIVEEMNPASLNNWIFNTCQLDEDTRTKLVDLVSRKDMSRRKKMKILLNIVESLGNGYELLEKYCEEHDALLYDNVFRKHRQMMVEENPDGAQQYEVSHEKEEGLQRLSSTWIDFTVDPKGSAPTWNFKLENVRKAWRSIEEVLVEELSPRHILDVFTEERLLSPDQCQDLRKKKRREMSKELLQIVKDDLPDAFFVLLKALKEDGEDELIHLLTNIIDEKKYVEEFTDDIGHIKQHVGNVNQKVGHVKDQVGHVKDQVGDVKDQVGDVKDQGGDVKDKVHEVKFEDSDLKKNFEVVQNTLYDVQKEDLHSKEGGLMTHASDQPFSLYTNPSHSSEIHNDSLDADLEKTAWKSVVIMHEVKLSTDVEDLSTESQECKTGILTQRGNNTNRKRKAGGEGISESGIPEKLHRRVLNRCWPELLRDLDFKTVSMYLKQKEILDDVTMEDLMDDGAPPDKKRRLIQQITQRDRYTYEKFKECLVLAKQGDLKDMLEEEERVAINKDIETAPNRRPESDGLKQLKKDLHSKEGGLMTHASDQPFSLYTNPSHSSEIHNDSLDADLEKTAWKSVVIMHEVKLSTDVEDLSTESQECKTGILTQRGNNTNRKRKAGGEGISESGIPEKLHRRVLNRCWPELLRDLDFKTVSMYLKQKEILDDVTMEDLMDDGAPPDKKRRLIQQITQRDRYTYEKFKECLVLAKQGDLKDMLEEEERVAINKDIETAPNRRPESDGLIQLKSQTENMLGTVKKLGYIPTTQAAEAEKLLEEKRSVIIKGNPGEGKTTIAIHLIDNEMYRDRRVVVYSPRDWKTVDTDWVDIVVLEDILGKYDLDPSCLQEWMVYLPTIQEHVDAGKLQVIITTRVDVLAKADSKLRSLELFSDHLSLTLSSKNLNQLEKMRILNGELQRHNKAMNEDEKEKCIANFSGLIGFPQACLLFAADSKLFKKGPEFFKSPNELFFKNICNLNDEMFISLAFLFCHSKIYEEHLSPEAMPKSSNDLFMELASYLHISKTKADITLLRNAYEILEGLYIKKSISNDIISEVLVTKTCFRFSHATVCEAVGHVLAKRSLEMVVKHGNPEYLYQRTYTAEAKDKTSEKVFLPVSMYSSMAERMVHDVVEKTLVKSAAEHSVLKQNKYLMKLKDVLHKGNRIKDFFMAKSYSNLKFMHSFFLESRFCDQDLSEGECLTFLQYVLQSDDVTVRSVFNHFVEFFVCTHNNNNSDCWQCKEKQNVLELALYYHFFEIADKLITMNAYYTHVSLCNAARHGDLSRVQTILEDLKRSLVFNPDCTEAKKALCRAYLSRSQDVIEILLQEGITLDSIHLVHAVKHGDIDVLKKVVEHLKFHNKWHQLCAYDSKSGCFYDPDMYSGQIASVLLFPIQLSDSAALYIAYCNEKFEMADYLLQNEVKISMGMLAAVVEHSSKKAVDWVIQHLKVTHIWDSYCDDASQALGKAYGAQKYDVCDMLIQEGVLMTVKNLDCVIGRFKISLKAVKKAVRYLKNTEKWDPKCKDASKALANAYREKKYDVCDLLIQEGVSITMEHVPHLILRSLDYVKTVVKQLKDTDIWDPKCDVASKALANAYRKEKYDVCDLLIQEGASLTMKNLQNLVGGLKISLEAVKKAVQHLKDTNNWDPNCEDASEALEVAYEEMKYDVCDLLIQEGVSLTMKNLQNVVLGFKISLEAVKKAVQHLKDTSNWDPNCEDASEALEVAYEEMKYDVCDLLIQEGVSLTMKNLQNVVLGFKISLEAVKKAVQHLKDTSNWDPKSDYASIILTNAISAQIYDVYDLLVQEGVSLTMKNLPLLVKGLKMSLESVKKAVQHLKDNNNWDPKCDDASDALTNAYIENRYDVCDLLIQEGAFLTMKNLKNVVGGFKISLEAVKKAVQHLKDTSNWDPKSDHASITLTNAYSAQIYDVYDLLVQEGVLPHNEESSSNGAGNSGIIESS